MRSLRTYALLTLFGCLVATTGCGDGSSAALEARRVFERTTPPGLGSCWSGELRRVSAAAFEASCQFSLSGEWSDYKRWLTSAIKPYSERNETPEAITFSRTTKGDVYAVRAELVNDPPMKSVRVVFHAAAW